MSKIWFQPWSPFLAALYMALLFGNGSAFELCPLDDDDLCALPIGTKFSIRSDCTVFTKTTSLSKAIKREPGVAFGLWMDRSHLFGNEAATISPQNLRLAFDQGCTGIWNRDGSKWQNSPAKCVPYLKSVSPMSDCESALLHVFSTQRCALNFFVPRKLDLPIL